MSFLNPVNEPVLRFSSTDADAPQINYAARTAGDVKAVLKACLVTGYGTTASAGWSVVNEVDHVAEFASPSVAMRDYRFGVDDNYGNYTKWYYTYEDTIVNPAYRQIDKSFYGIDESSTHNGWVLLVTARGFILIELVQHLKIQKLSGRITYFGQIKSSLIGSDSHNMMFLNVGHSATITQPQYMYTESKYIHMHISTYTSSYLSTAAAAALIGTTVPNVSSVDLISPIYITDSTRGLLLGELPVLMPQVVNNPEDIYGISESVLSERSVLVVCAGNPNQTYDSATARARRYLVYLDYWSY